MTRRAITGAEDIADALEALGRDMRRVLVPAVRKGARHFQRAAKARVAVDEGRVRESIIVQRDKERERGSGRRVAFRIGPRKGRRTSSVAVLLEYGAPVAVSGGSIPGKTIPARPAQPFLRPAYEENRRKAQGIVADDARAGLKKIARKKKARRA